MPGQKGKKMGRLIDADKFKGYMQDKYILFDHTLEDIDAQPTVDAEPIRHGHIVYREHRRINYGKYTGFDENGEEHTITVCEDYGSGKEPYCSECGSQLAESFLNYCPKCGAKMDEVEDND